MQEFIKKHNIESYFEELPDVNKQVLLESNWEQDVWTIAKKHGLLLEEIDALVEEIGLVLLGAVPTGSLQANLRSHANIHDTEMISEIIREVNATIFIPMQDKIKELIAHPKRDDLMSAIEDGPNHPASQKTETVAHKKLSDIFAMAPAKSDHSEEMEEEKEEVPTSYADGEDPYHEPID